MSTSPAPLPLEDMPAARVLAVQPARTTRTGKPVKKRNGRVTSVQVRPEDDAVLAAYQAKVGVKAGEAFRLALHRAAAAEGIDVDSIVKGVAA